MSVHIALGTYESATKTMKRSHCSAMGRIITIKGIIMIKVSVFAFSLFTLRFCVFKVSVFKERFQLSNSQFSKSVFKSLRFQVGAEQCEHTAKSEIFLSVLI